MSKAKLQDLGDRLACAAVWLVVAIAALAAVDFLPSIVWPR